MSERRDQNTTVREKVSQARAEVRQEAETERQVVLEQSIEQGKADELQAARAEAEREAEAVRQQIADDVNAATYGQRARNEGMTKALILFVVLLVLMLLGAATDRPDAIQWPGVNGPGTALEAQLASGASGANGAGVNLSDIPAPGSVEDRTYTVAGLFQEYYNANGGERVFGRPISDLLEVNGRAIQWFERIRLEQWPEYAGTSYAIQGGRIGTEFTQNEQFPDQEFFVSRPGARFFAETSHGVVDPFLSFWEQNGGLERFGYPISEQVQEKLDDGQIYTVQYFERARLELHPNSPTPYNVQIGLLGTAMRLYNSKPNIIAPVAPTPLPMPSYPSP